MQRMPAMFTSSEQTHIVAISKRLGQRNQWVQDVKVHLSYTCQDPSTKPKFHRYKTLKQLSTQHLLAGQYSKTRQRNGSNEEATKNCQLQLQKRGWTMHTIRNTLLQNEGSQHDCVHFCLPTFVHARSCLLASLVVIGWFVCLSPVFCVGVSGSFRSDLLAYSRYPTRTTRTIQPHLKAAKPLLPLAFAMAMEKGKSLSWGCDLTFGVVTFKKAKGIRFNNTFLHWCPSCVCRTGCLVVTFLLCWETAKGESQVYACISDTARTTNGCRHACAAWHDFSREKNQSRSPKPDLYFSLFIDFEASQVSTSATRQGKIG